MQGMSEQCVHTYSEESCFSKDLLDPPIEQDSSLIASSLSPRQYSEVVGLPLDTIKN